MIHIFILVLFFKLPHYIFGDINVSNNKNVKIVGGKNVSISDVPYLVSIRDHQNNHFCGGAVINKYNVLTAAHCYDNHKKQKLYCVLNANTIYDGTRYPVRHGTIHPNYNPVTIENDIAILHLATMMDLENKTARSIALSKVTPPTNTSCIVSGWGSIVVPLRPDLALASVYLQAARLPIFSQEKCLNNYLESLNLTLNKNGIICAGYEDGRSDTCQGDSGGPLVCNDSLSGIVSWGYRCATPKIPGIYTDVSKYRKWVLDNLSTSISTKFYANFILTAFSLIIISVAQIV